MLKIFNTLTHKKDIFKPNKSNEVNLYVCGVTVYDFCHVGHGRTFLVFDMIVRYFKYCNYKVNYVRNITDIDDKIILNSILKKESFINFSNQMIIEMNNDFSKLNLLKPDIEPRVSDCISEIIFMIFELIKNNHAYIGKNGDVFFSVNSYKKYGNFSKQILIYLQSKNNKLNQLVKNSKFDFVLWKLSKNLNEPSWKSPWGKGRPGWHIECSAIIYKYLGKNIDIHGGGIDLLFPHHENEIAQTYCFHQYNIVNYWIHSGLVVLNNHVKMSKSSGNSLFLREILKEFDGNIMRFFYLSTHYKSPLNFNIDHLKKSKKSFDRLYQATLFFKKDTIKSNFKNIKISEEQDFHNAMKDDFNTPKALSILFTLVKKINFYKNNNKLDYLNLYSFKLKSLIKILGFFTYKENMKTLKYGKYKEMTYKNLEIQSLIKLRNIARQNKNWLESDKIRKKLNNLGIVVQDTNILNVKNKK